MISVRVDLEFDSSSATRTEHFSTLVSVTSAEHSRGAHLEIALWRARVLGFVGPPVRVEVISAAPALENSRLRHPARRTRR